MTPGSIYLIAYPDWRRADVRGWHDAMFAETGKSKPAVALFAAPGGEDPEEITWITSTFRRRYGAETHPVRLLHSKTSPHDARSILRGADLLYFTGGDPFLLVRAAQSASITEDIRRRQAEGAVVGAYSAGAIAIGGYWPEWPKPDRPDLPEEGATLVACLGLNTQAVFDFHGESDRWEELYACLRLLRERYPRREWRGYGVPTRGAVRIKSSGEVECLGACGPWL